MPGQQMDTGNWRRDSSAARMGKSLELEQPQYFVDGRGTLQAKKGR